MKFIFLSLLMLFSFLIFSVQAQVAMIEYETVTEPMDRVAGLHKAMYSHEPFAGASDELMPQENRYNEMVREMDLGVEHHVNTLFGRSVIEKEARK
jgi:hypothetical protein